MLVQSTERFATIEEAEDSLAGLKNLDFFLLGYVLQAPTIQVVWVGTCSDGDLVRGQKLVTAVATNPDAEA